MLQANLAQQLPQPPPWHEEPIGQQHEEFAQQKHKQHQDVGKDQQEEEKEKEHQMETHLVTSQVTTQDEQHDDSMPQ